MCAIDTISKWKDDALKSKVDIKEVQKTLNDFQAQIGDQLAMFMARSESKVTELVGKSCIIEHNESTHDGMISHLQSAIQNKLDGK